MQRIQYRQFGGPEMMAWEAFDLPEPGQGEIIAQVYAASVNPLDWKLRQGFMKLVMGRRFPKAMGNDFSGVVVKVGPEVSGLAVGDAVLGSTPLTKPGTFADAVLTNANLVIKKPAAISFEIASTFATVGVTAYRSVIEAGGLKPGQSIFINGGAGGVGQAATSLARWIGANVTVRVGTASLSSFSEASVAKVLDYKDPIPADLKGKFDVVFDCHGGLSAKEERDLLKSTGVAVDIDPTVGNLIRSLLSRKHRMVRGVASTDILQRLSELARAGAYSVPISREVPKVDAIGLIKDLEAGRRVLGKAVIVFDQPPT